MCALTRTRSRSLTHARTHAHARTHTHTHTQFVDTKTVASAIDDEIALWDVETGQKKGARTITPATDYVFGGEARRGRVGGGREGE